MRSAVPSRQSSFRRCWAILLVVAMTLAPALMHGGGAQASPASHHGSGQVTSAVGAHAHGHHEHAADPKAGDTAEAPHSAGAGACLFCVICVGAADLDVAVVAPARRHLSHLLVSSDSLVARDPAPGFRPPLI
jgi:hypothetical protein